MVISREKKRPKRTPTAHLQFFASSFFHVRNLKHLRYAWFCSPLNPQEIHGVFKNVIKNTFFFHEVDDGMNFWKWKFVRISSLLRYRFSRKSKTPDQLLLQWRLPYIQFIKSWICSALKRDIFLFFFGIVEETRKMKSKRRIKKKKTSNKRFFWRNLWNSSFYFLLPFHRFLCLLKHISFTQSAPRQRTNKNRTENTSYSFLGCEYFMLVSERGGETERGFWKRVSIVLKDSEKYFSGTFQCDEVMAGAPKIYFSPTVHLQSPSHCIIYSQGI